MKIDSYEPPGGEFFDSHLEATMLLNQFGTAVRAGYDAISYAPKLIEQMIAVCEQTGLAPHAIAKMRTAPAPFDEHVTRFAEGEAVCGYQYMQQVIVVRLSSILEASVTAMCEHVRGFVAENSGATRLRPPARPRQPKLGEFDAKLVAEGLEPLAISELADEIQHLTKLRNAIVHKDAIADQQLVSVAPPGMYQVGQPVQLRGSRLHRLITAVRCYQWDLVVRWDELYHNTLRSDPRPDHSALVRLRDQLIDLLRARIAEGN